MAVIDPSQFQMALMVRTIVLRYLDERSRRMIPVDDVICAFPAPEFNRAGGAHEAELNSLPLA